MSGLVNKWVQFEVIRGHEMGKEQRTVLIVDDEESIRDLIKYKLEMEGYECEQASSGDEALYKAFMKDFDIMLLDIKMPGLSGIEVLKKALVDHPDASILMITAVMDTNTAVEAMREGAYDYVTKPFDLEDLSMRVARALERRRLILENKEYQIRLEQKVKDQSLRIEELHDRKK